MEPKARKPFAAVIREARQTAAKVNPALSTYQGAAEALNVGDSSSIGKWERGENVPSNHNILAMADAYNAPELQLYYCSRVCPIGRMNNADPCVGSLAEVSINLYIAAEQVEKDVKKLLLYAADGVIDESEQQSMSEILDRLTSLENGIKSYKVTLQKVIDGRGD